MRRRTPGRRPWPVWPDVTLSCAFSNITPRLRAPGHSCSLCSKVLQRKPSSEDTDRTLTSSTDNCTRYQKPCPGQLTVTTTPESDSDSADTSQRVLDSDVSRCSPQTWHYNYPPSGLSVLGQSSMVRVARSREACRSAAISGVKLASGSQLLCFEE